MDDSTIIMFLLGGIGLVISWILGSHYTSWNKAKEILRLIEQSATQMSELMKTVNDALYDDKVTEEEFRMMYKELEETIVALNTLWKAMTNVFGVRV